MPVEEDLLGKLVEIGDGGTFLKIHARAEDAAILHWASTIFSRGCGTVINLCTLP
jgi:hypothetical protein